MRAALLLVVLLSAPVLAGCVEDEPRLATPTDRPPSPPRPPTPTRATVSLNFSDPGVVMTGAWRVGDGWDYESNQSHYRRVRVVDARVVGGVQMYVVEERTGDVGAAPSRVATLTVDGRAWQQLNASDDKGTKDVYSPGLPLRAYKNGTFSYNHTRTDALGRVLLNESVAVATRLYAPHTTILFPWGYVEAKRADHIVNARPEGGARTVTTTTRWVHVDYLNDVQYQLPSGETYKLTAVKAGDFRRGTLSSA